MLAHLSLDIQITNPGLWISMSFRSKFTKKQTTVYLSSRPLCVENSSLKWSQSCVLMPYYYRGFTFLFQYVSIIWDYMAFFPWFFHPNFQTLLRKRPHCRPRVPIKQASYFSRGNPPEKFGRSFAGRGAPGTGNIAGHGWFFGHALTTKLRMFNS